jgi:predicted nuclease with TOPRIM domain
MNEPVKVEEVFLNEIKLLQSKFQESIYKLGNLQIEKMELDRLVTEFVEKEKKLKDEWGSLQNLEKSLMDKIVQKYGEGNLNMSDGTFIPSNSPPQ